MNDSNQLQASFSTLILSIGSSAAFSLGLTPNPETGKVEKDLNMTKFNIDLLKILQEKTKNNLNTDEEQLLKNIVSDLQFKYVEEKGKK